MERWGLFSVMSSPIVYFLTTLLAVCPNINPTILCAHVCDVVVVVVAMVTVVPQHVHYLGRHLGFFNNFIFLASLQEFFY